LLYYVYCPFKEGEPNLSCMGKVLASIERHRTSFLPPDRHTSNTQSLQHGWGSTWAWQKLSGPLLALSSSHWARALQSSWHTGQEFPHPPVQGMPSSTFQ